MKKIGVFCIKSLMILTVSIILGTVLLWLVYCIPTDRMEDNMKSSAEVFAEEGLYPNIPKWAYSILDNWTDAIMLGEAGYKNNLSPINEAMSVSRTMCNTGIPTESLVNQYIKGQWSDWSETYERYWHGYLIFLKPALLIINYSQIRVVNAILEIGLIIAISALLYKNKLKNYILPFILSILCIRLISMILCMGFSLAFYVLLISSLVILLMRTNGKADESLYYVFLITGICTGYFDVLAWPVATFGIPAVFYFLTKESSNIDANFKDLIIIGLCWFFGYGLMWAGKWVVGTVITGNNYFVSAFTQIGEVTGTDRGFSYLDVVYNNIRDFILSPMVGVSILYAGYLLVYIIVNHSYMNGDKKTIISTIFTFGLLCVFPFFYYLVMKRHVGIHHFLFENKVLIITTFSGLCMLTKLKSIILFNKKVKQ